MLLHDILRHNEQFVENEEYTSFKGTKFPSKRMVVLTCMDARLVELIPRALNIQNGEAIILKNAGGIITHPFGSIMRSMVVAIHELKAAEIYVIGHHRCGMNSVNPKKTLQQIIDQGVTSLETISNLEFAGVDLQKWLHGFDNVIDSVKENIEIIRNHPLIPNNIPIHGLVIDPETGKLDLEIDGYEKVSTIE
jgi:carbonic anhydrase